MGVLTSFYLFEREFLEVPGIERGFNYLWNQEGSPTAVGLPEDYRVRSCGIDKSWDDWSAILYPSGNDQLAEILEDWAENIENDDGIWLRVLRYDAGNQMDNAAFALDGVKQFDAKVAISQAVKLEVEGYEGEQMSLAEIEYVVSHIDDFSKWLQKEYRAGDVLIIASQ